MSLPVPRKRRPRPMIKRTILCGLAVLATAAVGASTAGASSHREAPLISQDPEADLNDLYAFVDRHDHSKVDLILTAVPLEEPGDAPNYYRFGEGVNYDVNVDPDGDADKDVTYRFKFKTHTR